MEKDNVRYLVDSLSFAELQKAGKLMQLLHGKEKIHPFSDEALNRKKSDLWQREMFVNYFASLDVEKNPIIVTAIEASFLAIVTTLKYNSLKNHI